MYGVHIWLRYQGPQILNNGLSHSANALSWLHITNRQVPATQAGLANTGNPPFSACARPDARVKKPASLPMRVFLFGKRRVPEETRTAL